MSKALSGFTTDELLAEMVRRRNDDEAADVPQHFCGDCQHFKFSVNYTDGQNNCQKRHTMAFRMSDHPHDEDFGFYRRVCKDRAARVVDARPRPRHRDSHR